MTPALPCLALGLWLVAGTQEPSAPTSPAPPAPLESEPVPSLVPPSIGRPLEGFVFKLAAMDDDERQRLERYLADLVGFPLTFDLLVEADERITSIRRYEKARCVPLDDGRALCDIWRARVLREVRVEGLPGALLESDLMKRVFLRPGEPLDEETETSGKSRLVRQRSRIEDFLEREGFYGAEVRLLVRKVNGQGERDVVIRVRGGSFVRVRRVDVDGVSPLPQNTVREAFGQMCFSGEGLLDGVFVGNIISCFNKRRLQVTVDRFVDELHELGYPEARVRAEPAFVDPRQAKDANCAYSPVEIERYDAQGLKPPPRCVDLMVDIDPGTKVTARFHGPPDEPKLTVLPDFLGGTILWLRETIYEPVSRLLQQIADAPSSTAADTDLVGRRMQDQLTFEETGAVDETEIEVSARKVEEYLASRGRIEPSVVVEDREFPGERVVDFYAQPSPIATIRSIRFVGNERITAEEILDGTELAAHPRSFTHSGAISPALLTDDEERIRAFYADRGYPEATVTATTEVDPQGNIDVVFLVEEGEAFLLAGVVLAGGAPELTPEVLRAIRHCEGGIATLERREPHAEEDCRSAPLRPDELDADAQRVQGVYASHGYPNVEAAVETSFSPEGAVVRISVVPLDATEAERRNPKPGNVKQVELGEVFLEGNQDTRRDVLLREAGLDGKSGEPLDPLALGKGISRLRRTGLYESVELQYLGLEGESDRAHVRLSVAERPAFTVDTSVGFSTEQLVSWRNEVRHRNLFGTMLDANWLFDFGLFVGRFSQTRTQVRWPRIFGSDISASVVPLAVSYLDEPAGVRLGTPSTPAGQKATASWESPDLRRRLFSLGGGLGLDWRLRDVAPIVDDKLTFGVAVELRYDWLDPAGEPFNPFSQEAFETLDGLLTVFDNDVTQVAALTPRVAYNNVDNPFDPRDGLGLEVFFRGSSPPFVANGPYGVLGINARGYLTLFDRFTVAAGGRSRLGFAATSDACEDPGCEWALMQNDLLLLGGERSVRGVEENQIGVLGPAYDQQLERVLDDAGQPIVQLRPGYYGIAASVELRYTLIRQLFIGEVRPAAFFDVGVSTDDFDFDFSPTPSEPRDLRYATGVGVGIRYVLPVGPLALDFAWSPTRGTYATYLNFGYVF